MASDILSVGDAEFHAWLENFVNFLTANAGPLGLVSADVTPISVARDNWSTAYAAHVAAQNAAMAARATKDQARAALVALLRPLIARIQASPTTTNAHRAGLGIPIRSKDRKPSPVPTTRPMLVVDTSQRLCHTIRFSDESTPNSRAKPKGVAGCEIWCKVGEAPPNDCNDCQYLATDTASPYVVECPGAKRNQVAYYMARWVNTRGEPGPWSETAAATIGA